MTRSFRFLLHDTRWRLLTLVWECLFLAVFYAVTGYGARYGYGINISGFLMPTLVILASTLGNCAAPNALSLGGRRIDIFWGIQGCALVYALCATLLTLAVNAITGVLGWPVLDLNLAVALFYPFACFSLSILGVLAGILAPRRRWLSVLLFVGLVLLSILLCFSLLLYSGGRLQLWGSLPWLIPLILGLLWLAGEGFIYREIQHLCVR